MYAFLPTNRAVPAKATAMAARNLRLTLVPKKSQPMSTTKMEARFASKVAFATEVNLMDQCQMARSVAKHAPTSASTDQSPAFGRVNPPPDAAAHMPIMGNAKAIRQ